MEKKFLRVVALLIAAALVLSGCSLDPLLHRLETVRDVLAAGGVQRGGGLLFSQMEYVRPDMEQHQAVWEDACEKAGSTDLDTVLEGVWAYFDIVNWFYTYYSLADIHYSQDLSSTWWEEEYNYCVDNSAVVDARLEEFYHVLAKSPCREALEGEAYFGPGYFDSYDGENNWDETFIQLLQREGELQNRYYELSGDSVELEQGSQEFFASYADQTAQVLVDLITVRNEMAAYWGYESYADFAWDFYYYRDYTLEEMDVYLEQICRELVPLYRELVMTDVGMDHHRYASEEQISGYVRDAAENMGGLVREAFRVMEARELYDVSYGAYKYDTSFEVYLTSYEMPFVYVCPMLENYDKLVFAHEFGHFCNDYYSYGSIAGADVLELFSQGMEYLSLCYSEDVGPLVRVKLADSLVTYVEQAAFATFEHRLYELKDPTVEELYALYEEVALQFGFESVGYDPREFITISHFYTKPLYIDSYVVSNDAAMQIYQLEQETSGAGLALYEKHLDTQELWFLSFLETAGLDSPFTSGRLASVAELFRQELLS